MNKLFLMMAMVLISSQLYAASTDSCIYENIAREADNQLNIDPITTKIILSSAPDCDEKYAFMHKANVEIAKKCRMEFYYQGKINPHGWYDQTPNIYEKHVMENSDQFKSGSEGADRITANDYWIKKIKNPNHPVFADFEYDKLRWYFHDVWEDGDGSMHSDKLIKEFTEWINKYPNHAKVPEAKKYIAFMKNYQGNLIPFPK